MKRKIIIISALIIAKICNGQTNTPNLKGDTLENSKKILYIISFSNQEPVATENIVINVHNIDSMADVSYNKAVNIYQIMKVIDIWIIYPNATTTFLTLNSIFNKYNIRKTDQSLPVRIDNWIVSQPGTIFADSSEIFSVKVIKNFAGISFINIITNHPRKKRVHKSGDVILY